MEKVSVIMTHWAMDDTRSEVMRRSLTSLIETTKQLPVEIIVIDNGASLIDSTWLLTQVHQKAIQYYVRNSENMYFGFGRNQGIDIACGEYVVISDNDILYAPGWLEKCIELLKAFPDEKLIATPLKTDYMHRQEKYWGANLEYQGETFPLNMRAGSNSFVMKRKDLDAFGKFRNHRIAGSKFNDVFVRQGFHVITMETNPLAEDIGFRQGYNINQNTEIARVFTNGERIIINS